MPVTLVVAVQLNAHDDPFARLALQPTGFVVGALYAPTFAPLATVGALSVGDTPVTVPPVLLATVMVNVALPPANRHAAGAADAVIAMLTVRGLTDSVLDVLLRDVAVVALLRTFVTVKVTVPLSAPLVV